MTLPRPCRTYGPRWRARCLENPSRRPSLLSHGGNCGEVRVAEDFARDFFISYTGVNESWAKWIAVTLEQAGYTTLVQAFDFGPGNDFIHKMHEATSSTKRTIAVLSPAYFGSQFGEAEWRVAFAKDPSGEQGLLVPVRVQPCQPAGLLAGRVYIDLVDVEEATARERLLEGVKVKGTHPSTAVYPGEPASQ